MPKLITQPPRLVRVTITFRVPESPLGDEELKGLGFGAVSTSLAMQGWQVENSVDVLPDLMPDPRGTRG